MQHQYAASVWAVMERFGQVLGVDELNGADIHRAENVMTMDMTLHTLFDALGIWLEATVSCVFWICEVESNTESSRYFSAVRTLSQVLRLRKPRAETR